MIKFLHHLLDPHCPDCQLEKQENSICDSCETLKLEVVRLRLDNEKLLDRLLDKHETVKVVEQPPVITRPTALPWRVRQQALEAEDRAKAASMRKAAQPDGKQSTEELEKELGVVEKARESVTEK